MATEASQTRAFLKRLRERYPAAVVFKHNDLRTGGIPDASVTFSGATVWIEFKRGKPTLTEIQKRTMQRLHVASAGRAIVIVFRPDRLIDIYDQTGETHIVITDLDDAITYLLVTANDGDGLGALAER